MTERRCPQCYRPGTGFVSDRPGAMCAACRKLYSSGGRRTPEERRRRLGASPDALPRVLVTERSGNVKLGPMPATLSTAETCPESCALRGEGCYAEFHVLGTHWGRAPADGLEWDAFLEWAGARTGLWRHNTAGDLAGAGDTLDVAALDQLTSAARGEPFTYTHKPLRSARERAAVRRAISRGFAVNLSADSPADADRLVALALAPVAALVPPGTRTGDRTPGGARIVVCPAQTDAGLQCVSCRLCAALPEGGRRGVVGFLPHGQYAAHVARRLPVVQASG